VDAFLGVYFRYMDYEALVIRGACLDVWVILLLFISEWKFSVFLKSDTWDLCRLDLLPILTCLFQSGECEARCCLYFHQYFIIGFNVQLLVSVCPHISALSVFRT
jgi:hypothetical protein